jgi:hypothetical protein
VEFMLSVLSWEGPAAKGVDAGEVARTAGAGEAGEISIPRAPTRWSARRR